MWRRRWKQRNHLFIVTAHSGTTSNTDADSYPNTKPCSRSFRTISRCASDCRQQPSTYCPRAAQSYNSKTLNEIQVGSRTVTVKYPGISVGKFINLGPHDNKMIASDGSLSYSRFGAYFGPDKSAAEIANGARSTQTNKVFSMGQVTTNMPTTGTAVYNGLSLGSRTGDVYDYGTSRFNVDFGAKTISGTVSNTAYSADLRGTISGAAFSGAHNGVNMSGNFYGPNAAELGGVYNGTSNGKSVVGSFGAKQ